MSRTARSVAYAHWIDRHRRRVIAVSIAIAIVSGWLAIHLPVQADMSSLLPPSAESVQHLHAIEKRARVIGTAMVAIESDDPVHRAAAASAMRQRLLALRPDLISSVTFDDGVGRQFAWDHRWLAVSLADLTAARDALRDEIHHAKLAADPLYIDLDDPPKPATGATDLRARLRDAEAKKAEPGELVSKDGHVQLIIVRTAHSSGDVEHDEALIAAVRAAIAEVRATLPDVEIGIAGDVVLTVAEHDAILNGMLIATAVTVGLVLIALLLFYRSVMAVGALSWSLMVGALATFGAARLGVGHLNLATAFLSSIVIGNGINFGILLTARYADERRVTDDPLAALAAAIGGTLAGTLAAALTAAVAYGSLILTAFRGFRDFGIIAGVGILLCWIATYTVLPAALAIAARTRFFKVRPAPAIGRVLARLAPRRPMVNAIAMIALTTTAGALTYRYLAGDPFESNFRNLRSHSAEIDEEQRWMTDVDRGFGQGISGGFVIAVADRADTAPLVDRLRKLDDGKADQQKLFSRVGSLDDLLPADQPQKLAVLADIRTLLSDDAIDSLADRDRADAIALRPPADLRALRDADIPEELAWPFIEADGSRGKLVLAMSGWGYDTWDATKLVRFSENVRALDLGPDVLLGGESFVFADMLQMMNHDGPFATLVSMLGAILVVLVVVGAGRHGAVTVLCGIAGTLLMLALASLLGLRVNFLDFVALPITIGIGIDYAVNIAARDRQERSGDPAKLLAGAGSAVLLCSFTTIVGYGSLLLSQNQGIRSFGAAAILGEGTCLSTALVFAPALLMLFARHRRGRTSTPPSTST